MHKNSLTTLTTRDRQQWKSALEQTQPYDFYHLPEFHHLAEINGEGDAVMLVYKHDGHTIAFPMLLRSLEVAGTAYRDAGCVHGFVGPLTSSAEFPEHVRLDFIEKLQEFFVSENVISAFSRLHPLIERSNLFTHYGNIVDVGATLSIDLSPAAEEQLAKYRRNHRQDINRLKNTGYTCRRVGKEHLTDFLRIYLDTMDRIQADKIYYYDRTYFEHMMSEMNGITHLFICEKNGSVASSALCVICNGIIQVHLAGTDADHKKYAPMKLVFDTIREWGNEIGATLVHLGGGVGAKKDSLYSFKKGFGSDEHPYRMWQHIVNPHTYKNLCVEALDKFEPESEGTFFPVYRNPCLQLKTENVVSIDKSLNTDWQEGRVKNAAVKAQRNLLKLI